MIRESVQTSMRNCVHRDRDDIELWALQVVQGKWTEEKFQERLKEKL